MAPITCQNALQSIVPYTPRCYPTLKAFYASWGRIAPNKALLPMIGYIVDGRVAGFLYQTDSNVAMIEGIVSHKDTIPSLRRASLMKLCSVLTDKALELGYTNIFGISRHPSIKQVADKLGYRDGGAFTILTLSEND